MSSTGVFLDTFAVRVVWEGERHGTVTAPPRPTIVGGAPPEFNGKDTWWSPQHLLIASAALGVMSTFVALCAREQLPLLSYASRATARLEKTQQGLAFAAIVVDVELAVEAKYTSAATDCLQRAKERCMIVHSLKTPVELLVRVDAR